MERLTIKELAPYLPYGVKVCNGDDTFEVTAMNNRTVFFKGGLLDIKDIKPLLRPLSYLTEERQFGEYRSEIEEIIKEAEQHCDAYDEWLDIFIDDPDPSRILQSPYEVVQELIEKHFDVFGLIDSGLALPIEGKEVEER